MTISLLYNLMKSSVSANVRYSIGIQKVLILDINISVPKRGQLKLQEILSSHRVFAETASSIVVLVVHKFICLSFSQFFLIKFVKKESSLLYFHFLVSLHYSALSIEGGEILRGFRETCSPVCLPYQAGIYRC